MKNETLFVIGGLGVLGVIVLIVLSKQKQQTALAQQALNNQYAATPAGQVGDILSSVGGFFNSGALNSLFDLFPSSGSSNQPGLITPSPVSSSNSSAGNLNTPGLNTPTYVNYGPVALPSDLYVNQGPVALPSDLAGTSSNDPGLVGTGSDYYD